MKWSKLSVPSISKDVLGLVFTLGFTVKVVKVVFVDKVEVVFVGLVTIHIKRTHICNIYVLKPTTLELFDSSFFTIWPSALAAKVLSKYSTFGFVLKNSCSEA